MPGYRITPEARDDLQDIARYTLDTWGAEQHARYRDQLADCFNRIAHQSIVQRNFSKTYPELCVVRCEHHYAFYFPAEKDKPAIIIAVFHEKMNCIARLKGRLG
jgi:plasmid stabilization system protein ParE